MAKVFVSSSVSRLRGEMRSGAPSDVLRNHSSTAYEGLHVGVAFLRVSADHETK